MQTGPKSFLPPPPQHIVRRAVLFCLGGCWRGSGVERSRCRLCICSRTDSTLGAREAGWAFGAGTGTTGARPAQQQQKEGSFFLPPLCSREPSRAKGGCQRLPGFFSSAVPPSQHSGSCRGKPLQQLCLITLICGEARKASLLNSLQTGPCVPEDFC